MSHLEKCRSRDVTVPIRPLTWKHLPLICMSTAGVVFLTRIASAVGNLRLDGEGQ